jgi:YidC/Oxa1 family membrane protein insertase
MLFVRGIRYGRAPRIMQKRNVAGFIESTLVGIHTYTHLPWYATIAISTVFVRLSLLPLVRAQILESKNLTDALPKVEYMVKLFKLKLNSKTEYATLLNDAYLVFKGSKAAFHLHDVSLLKLFAFPAVNFSLFATFVLSLRDMIVGQQRPDLTSGGILWFSDLVSKDTSYILPLTAVTISYLAIEISFRKSQSGFLLFAKDAFQSILIVALPFTIHMPCGLFFYWIPSSLCGIFQHILLKNPHVLKALRIPLPPSNTIRSPK